MNNWNPSLLSSSSVLGSYKILGRCETDIVAPPVKTFYSFLTGMNIYEWKISRKQKILLVSGKEAEIETIVETLFFHRDLSDIPENERRGYIITNMLHILCFSELGKERCSTFLKRYYETDGNVYVKTINNFIEEGCKDMGVNLEGCIVIKNPPFQQGDGGGDGKSAVPLYNKFWESCLKIKPKIICAVIPSRWMVGGKGLDGFRENMMNDRHIKKIIDFPNSTKIFPSVVIAGGICYVLWDSEYEGPCEFNGVKRYLNQYKVAVIRDSESIPIIEKVTTITTRYISDTASSRCPYGIKTKDITVKSGVPCLFSSRMNSTHGKTLYVEKHTNGEEGWDIRKWKVVVPFGKSGDSDFSKDINFFHNDNVVILPPGTICSETFIVLKAFKTEKESKFFKSYVLTKTFQFMLYLLSISQNITRKCYGLVPEQEIYDHVFSDKELYIKYKFSEKDIRVIEEKIK
jgi:hypothetical protein